MRRRHGRALDLNLLAALDAFVAERSVTRAADRLELTQSAASRVLARLRHGLGDPVLVRTRAGLMPTARALAVAAPVREALSSLARVVREEPPFDPRGARRVFRIAAVDYAQVTLLAPLLGRLAREAPGIDVELRQPSAANERDLESGALDLLIMPQQPSGPGVVWTPLQRSGYTCVVARAHSCRRLTLPRFAALEHVLVAPRESGRGVVDDVLAQHGLVRRIAVQVPAFLVLPYVLAGTDRIATVPVAMAAELVRRYPLRALAPPVAIPGFVLCQGWHELHRHDAGHRWLREAVARAAGRRPLARR